MSPKSPDKLARLIQTHREAAGMRRSVLARAVGVPDSTIMRLERAEIDAPNPDLIERVAAALEIEPEELFTAYPAPERLPDMAPYLRAKFGMSDEAVAEAEQFFSDLADKDKKGGGRAKRSR